MKRGLAPRPSLPARSFAMNSVDLATKIAVEQDGVVSARQCLASGMRWDEITQRCRLGSWRVVFRGVYFIYPEPLVPTRALIRAALLTAGPAAVAVLTSAADLHGLPFLPDDPALHVSVPGELNRLDQPGLLVHQLTIADSDCVTVDGMRATSRVRTVADLILRLSRFDAVALLDGALRLEKISTEDLLLVAAMIRGRRGAVKARRRLREADHRSASPLETRIRLICVDGGLPPEEVQYAPKYSMIVAGGGRRLGGGRERGLGLWDRGQSPERCWGIWPCKRARTSDSR